MFFLVLRKIINNKWLMISLLLGMVLTVAMVCSIPLYTNGILQRMLIKDLEAYQQKTNIYPAKYEVKLELYQNYSGPKKDSSIKHIITLQTEYKAA